MGVGNGCQADSSAGVKQPENSLCGRHTRVAWGSPLGSPVAQGLRAGWMRRGMCAQVLAAQGLSAVAADDTMRIIRIHDQR